MNLDSPPNPRHLSESKEHYTPSDIIERGRKVLGTIDLDPASSMRANAVVKADAIFTASYNGFVRPWSGRVFLNPPGGSCDSDGVMLEKRPPEKGWFRTTDGAKATGQSAQKAWWFKLAREWAEGRVTAAIFLCFSVELLQTTQNKTPLGMPIPLDFPICFPAGRVDYMKEKGGALVPGGAPPHSSAIVFLPRTATIDAELEDLRAFGEQFSALGRVVSPPSIPWWRRQATSPS
jgi:hypothetical protein